MNTTDSQCKGCGIHSISQERMRSDSEVSGFSFILCCVLTLLAGRQKWHHHQHCKTSNRPPNQAVNQLGLERYQAQHPIPNTLASHDTNTQYRYRK